MTTTSTIAITEGSGKNLANYSIAEDSLTKQLQRAALNDSNGNDIQLELKLGATNETAPTTDTAVSGLNGRLQRVSQRLTTLIALITTNLALVFGPGVQALAQRVTLASDSPGVLPQVFGPGNSANAQRTTLSSDSPGVPALGAPADPAVITDANGSISAYLRGLIKGKTIKCVTVNISADTDIVAAVASKRIKVIAYSLTSVGTNQNIVIFKSNGASGTELARTVLQGATGQPYGNNHSIPAPSFLFATVAGEKLTLDVNQTDTIYGYITYFDDDAT